MLIHSIGAAFACIFVVKSKPGLDGTKEKYKAIFTLCLQCMFGKCTYESTWCIHVMYPGFWGLVYLFFYCIGKCIHFSMQRYVVLTWELISLCSGIL